MAQDGLVLTESQLAALEKRRNEQEAYGEIDTEHPGYLGCQDTYYVGNFKGIGKVYTQVFIDSYSRGRLGYGKLLYVKTVFVVLYVSRS
ncbi:transposase [Cardinium endosymbiont of Sogatella furcifera]|nr:transposase [Cardinium endosymbiont of Sogatella furcifera]